MAEQRQLATPLSDLMRSRRAELGLGVRAIAEQCVDPDTGEQLAKPSWLERLEKALPIIPPQLPQLRAIAAGYRLPLRRVQDEAAVQFFGLEQRPAEWSSDSRIRAMVDRMEQLTDEQRDELAALAELYTQRRLAERADGE
ncbi:XRE family transcriptional regulator [Kitasatospora purpeofusca]|uniref:XRE family transcriptional regulator n=1 Tax=Kitasatospora purpeofusca TaxID=67352 RepID=UPI0035DB8559